MPIRPKPLDLTYLGLYALQHRGQESTGIASSDDEQVYLHKSMGHVADVYGEETLAKLQGVECDRPHALFDGRRQFRKQRTALDGEVTRYGTVALCHNGNLINAVALRRDLEEQGALFQSTSDSEVILHLLARSQETDILEALEGNRPPDPGRILHSAHHEGRSLSGCATRNGFRPLCLGKLNDSYVLASESCAFDLIDATVRTRNRARRDRGDSGQEPEIRAGAAFNEDVEVHLRTRLFLPSGQHGFRAHCSNKPRSDGTICSPRKARLMPIWWFRFPTPEWPPQSAIPQESGIPFAFGLIRNHYVGRTFIEPRKTIRHFGVKVKLNPVRELLKGKRVILIDDSLVRGTTSRKIVKMVRAAGATEVHMRITCPPTTWPCFYGVDTPTRKELIASTHTLEEICKRIEADSLAYLSLPGLLQAVQCEAERVLFGLLYRQVPARLRRRRCRTRRKRSANSISGKNPLKKTS